MMEIGYEKYYDFFLPVIMTDNNIWELCADNKLDAIRKLISPPIADAQADSVDNSINSAECAKTVVIFSN